jgi:hypothetical protein
MQIQCPKCKQIAPPNQVNVATDIAFCPQCNEGFRISAAIDRDSVNEEILQRPPRGAWFRQEVDKIVVGATTRSPVAFFLVPFMCVWSGGSLGGIYGSQIAKGEFNLTASLFGIPFILGSILFWTFALMAICGKVEVSIGRISYVFVGVGRIGWTRSFDWSTVQSIREDRINMNYPGGHQSVIVMEGKERLKFGSGLNEKRIFFVLSVLKLLKSRSR